MYLINGDPIRQLNNIFKISLKPKFKEVIKERVVFFVEQTYKNKTLEELRLLKKEVVFKDLEIVKLEEEFFNKHGEALLNSLNPLWYSTEQKIILTEAEKRSAEGEILLSLIKSSSDEYKIISNKYTEFFSKHTYFWTREEILINIYQKIGFKQLNKNKKIIIREEEIQTIRKMILEDQARQKRKISEYITMLFSPGSFRDDKHLREILKEYFEKDDWSKINSEELSDELNVFILNYEITVLFLEKLKELFDKINQKGEEDGKVLN